MLLFIVIFIYNQDFFGIIVQPYKTRTANLEIKNKSQSEKSDFDYSPNSAALLKVNGLQNNNT